MSSVRGGKQRCNCQLAWNKDRVAQILSLRFMRGHPKDLPNVIQT